MDYELLLSNFRNYVDLTDNEWQKAASSSFLSELKDFGFASQNIYMKQLF
jgi:hypothetical protein